MSFKKWKRFFVTTYIAWLTHLPRVRRFPVADLQIMSRSRDPALFLLSRAVGSFQKLKAETLKPVGVADAIIRGDKDTNATSQGPITKRSGNDFLIISVPLSNIANKINNIHLSAEIVSW